jgi:hypothetical protein
MRCAADGAILLRMQFVLPFGRVSNALRIVLAISSSPISRGAPGRGSSWGRPHSVRQSHYP